MTLQSLYSSEMRHRLQVFPTWQPGDPVEVGDIGTLKNGVFEKQTSLTAHFPDIAFVPRTSKLEHPYRFQSKASLVASAGAGVSLPEGAARVDAKVQFGDRGGVVFDAAGLERTAIDNLLDVRTKIRARRAEWPRGMVLVSCVDTAKRFQLLVSETGNSSVSLHGRAAAIAGFSIADPSVKIAIDSDAVYRTKGSGPVAAIVYGFGWLGYLLKRFKLLEQEPDELADDFDVFRELDAAEFPEG